MKKLLLISILFVLYSCGDDGPVIVEQPPEYNIDKQEVKLLYTRHCVDCHGEEGDLGLMGAKDLTTSMMSKEERIAIIKDGSANGKMKPFGLEHYGDLDNSQIEALAVYIEGLRTK